MYYLSNEIAFTCSNEQYNIVIIVISQRYSFKPGTKVLYQCSCGNCKIGGRMISEFGILYVTTTVVHSQILIDIDTQYLIFHMCTPAVTV